jgi:uncharacterized protein YecT (DUF1311 family)
MKRSLIIIALMLLCIIKAHSQQASSRIIDCNSVTTQIEMNECAKKDFDKADKELNEIYKKTMSLLTPESRQSLISAQKKWIEYRDTSCKVYEKLYQGGSMMNMITLNSKTRLTNERIKELKILLEEIDK